MPLVVQNRRVLSPLEKDAINLVFDGAIDPDDLTVEVPNQIIIAGDGVAGSYGGNGEVRISRLKHSYAEDLHIFTTVDDVDLTVPNNIKYLATLVHEAGHHWQWGRQQYTNRIPEYNFDDDVLESTDFVCKEQHASVGQVYFIVKWQLHHDHDPINLTTEGFLDKRVGPVNRYHQIAAIPHNGGQRFIDPPDAELLVDNFDNYLVDLN